MTASLIARTGAGRVAGAGRAASRGMLLLLACISITCQKDHRMFSRSGQQATVSRDVGAFMRLLNLPARPAEVWWEETPVGEPGGIGPTDYDLSAVLHFDASTAAAMAKKAPPLPEEPVLLPLDANRPWLPAPVRAAIQRHDGHFISVRGSKFDAQPFLKPPYTSGAFIVVDGDGYVYISVRTS